MYFVNILSGVDDFVRHGYPPIVDCCNIGIDNYFVRHDTKLIVRVSHFVQLN